MPPSGRGKAKTRARRAPAAEPQEASDAETPEAIQTPSRTSRKRARGSDNAAPAARNTRRKIKDTRMNDREDTEGTEANDQSDNETEPALPSEQEVISALRVADRPVNATEDFANDLLEGQENVPGYGKIAGRDWAFIIRKVEVNIGRPEAQEKLVNPENGQITAPTPTKTLVDIDLGPDRQVSRSHAVISYDPDQIAWLIVVNGRNGLRLDNTLLKRGARSYLRNGSVIEVAGTQMAFITTAAEDSEGPVWHDSILRQTQKSSEEDDDGPDDGRGTQQRTLPRNNNSNNGPVSGSGGHQSALGGSQQQTRTHPHSQRAAAPPGTPMRSQQSLTKSSPAANYSRGVMMESTESIDYSADTAKDLKPPHSYAQLIGMAILSTPEQQMTLNNIYKWIMANYAFYRFNTHGWQNSIRHNLSLNKAFTKIARRTDEPGKGMKWMIEPTEFDTFVQQGMKGCRRPNPIPGAHSAVGSPTSPVHPVKATSSSSIKRDVESTPPLGGYRPAYPTATEAYTPERSSKVNIKTQPGGSTGLGINGGGPDFDYAQSTPRQGMNPASNNVGSPPALYVNDDGRVGPLDTPFPIRPSQKLVPPSTLKRPSDFIQFSSPAPFWKMEGLVGSTPFKPYDLSPLKAPFSGFGKTIEITKKEAEASSPIDEKVIKTQDDADVKPKGSPVIASSSPPRPNTGISGLDASPTLSRPATAVAKTLSQLAASRSPETKQEPVGSPSVSEETRHSVPPPQPQAMQASSSHLGFSSSMTSVTGGYDSASPATAATHAHYASLSQPRLATGGFPMDDDDNEGIDLAKGFQPIGAFHQRNHMAMSMGVGAAGASFGR